MKFFRLILFFIFFENIEGGIFKTVFAPKLLSIISVGDSSINLYFYTTLRMNSNNNYKFDFELEEQKIAVETQKQELQEEQERIIH